ncbi:conserved hypothetical protein [Tenacibaculum dicentrarchi]|uniref:AbiTii domain-containing protein n=1 Tax=Tenacibaculum dicentrarchi TaxID=669041 RepID=A0ABP1EKM8_9FLAO|nr:conserved hypothetical protein [Tenacibaculum dicentrarchi]
MIKDLIKDLTYDKINLNQALTRAKLIAYELNNNDFKSWIDKELNGYKNGDKLPHYRIIPCDVYALTETFGEKRLIQCDLTDLDKNGKIYKMEAMQSISTIELGLKESNSKIYGYEDFPLGFVKIVKELTNNSSITSIKRRIQFSQTLHILNLTKQKLIDTLLELNYTFPNLQDNYKNTMENNEKTNTIINNHIYGKNANSAIGIGDNINQKIENVNHQKIEKVISDLKKLGVPNENIIEVKNIVNKETNKVDLGKQLMSWVGKITKKGIEKGIEIQVPEIMDKIQELI